MFVMASAFAYEYPGTLWKLLQQYADTKTSLIITTDEANLPNTTFDFTNQHEGTVRLVMSDYILFNDRRIGLIVISLGHIVSIQGE